MYSISDLRGGPLQVDNLRHRAWYPGLDRAKLRKRTMYQTRHSFASSMLSHGEDPLWVARMLGHTTLDMIFRHYGKFIRNRARRDGTRFLKGMAEEIGALPEPAKKALPEKSERKLNDGSRHRFGTVVDFQTKKGVTQCVTP